MNCINITGRLTADVELRYTANNVEVCSFTVAVKRPNVKDTTDFINCVAWRQAAQFIATYFRKGQMIAITGVLTSRKFQDQNGKNHVAFEVLVDRAEFCESKQATAETGATDINYEETTEDDDCPF